MSHFGCKETGQGGLRSTSTRFSRLPKIQHMAFCTIMLVAAKKARSTFGTFVLKSRTRFDACYFAVSTKRWPLHYFVIGHGEKAVS
jgi:hypothetical protein